MDHQGLVTDARIVTPSSRSDCRIVQTVWRPFSPISDSKRVTTSSGLDILGWLQSRYQHSCQIDCRVRVGARQHATGRGPPPLARSITADFYVAAEGLVTFLS